MSSCARLDSLVTPYLDGALEGADLAFVDAHLRKCAPCRSRVEAERSVCTLIRSRRVELRSTQVPAALVMRCRAATSSTLPAAVATPTSSGWWQTRTFQLAVAAAVLSVGAVTYRTTVGQGQGVLTELAADHVKCFLINSVLGTQHEPELVESDMRSRFEWAAHLPEHPETADLTLVGSRPCLYERGKIAHIMYRHQGVPVSIFMLPGHLLDDRMRHALGHDAVTWSDANRTFVLVARAPRAEVEQVATFVQASLR